MYEVYIMNARYKDTKAREKRRIISRERYISIALQNQSDRQPSLHPNADNGLTAVALLTKTQQQKRPRIRVIIWIKEHRGSHTVST